MVKKTSISQPKAAIVKKREKRSFLPIKFIKPKPVGFRGDGHKEVGIEEPSWPTAEEQLSMDSFKRKLAVGLAFNWYNYTQNEKLADKTIEEALCGGNARPKLYSEIRKSEAQIGRTMGWLFRMAQMGLVLSFAEKRFIAKQIRKLLAHVPKTAKVVVEDTAAQVEKVTIQDRINAKLGITYGELEAAFDDTLAFAQGKLKQKPEIMGIFARTAPPSNRMKDIVAYAERPLHELTLAAKGVPPLQEAYSIFSKKEMKAMIGFWEEVIAATNSYGVIKRKNRKPRKRNAPSPEKLVSKLKYLKTFAPLKLNSIDATQLLKSTEVYVYNTKTRKLGVYIADSHASNLEAKGSRILNMDPVQSVQKTLRKPEKQLPEFLALGKPASVKFLKGIKSTEIKLKEALSKDCVILKAFK